MGLSGIPVDPQPPALAISPGAVAEALAAAASASAALAAPRADGGRSRAGRGAPRRPRASPPWGHWGPLGGPLGGPWKITEHLLSDGKKHPRSGSWEHQESQKGWRELIYKTPKVGKSSLIVQKFNLKHSPLQLLPQGHNEFRQFTKINPWWHGCTCTQHTLDHSLHTLEWHFPQQPLDQATTRRANVSGFAADFLCGTASGKLQGTAQLLGWCCFKRRFRGGPIEIQRKNNLVAYVLVYEHTYITCISFIAFICIYLYTYCR